jgi:hypothetical protein
MQLTRVTNVECLLKANVLNVILPLENKTITIDSGDQVQVSYCPDCDGMIKSPMCCGMDMSCEL